MSIKLNSSIISDELIKLMEDKINESKLKSIETGFSLCKNSKNDFLKIGNECEGTKCKIRRPSQKCRDKEDEYRGLYHTHPMANEARPSISDLYNMYKDGLGCIGSQPSKINCFLRKDHYPERDALNKLEYAYYYLGFRREDLPKDAFRKIYDASIKIFTDEYFKVINIK